VSPIALEVSNGVIAVIAGLTLYTVSRILRWIRSVDRRLDAIERKAGIDAPGPESDG
jgi:hypothetical protein